jgi:hypothetical protein
MGVRNDAYVDKKKKRSARSIRVPPNMLLFTMRPSPGFMRCLLLETEGVWGVEPSRFPTREAPPHARKPAR